MTNDELELIYKNALPQDRFAAMRAVYNAGFHAGSGNPALPIPDYSVSAKPPAVEPVLSADIGPQTETEKPRDYSGNTVITASPSPYVYPER